MEADEVAPQYNGMDKITRYGWSNNTTPCVYQELNKTVINIDHSYQRPLVLGKITQIARDWDETLCGVITVGQRADGTYWVVDGQHRLCAALKRSDVQVMRCTVFQSTGPEQEAKYFVGTNTMRKLPRSMDLFNAKLMSRDEVAVSVNDIVLRNGYKFATRKGLMCINCVTAVCDMYKKHGGDAIESALKILEPIYSVTPECVNRDVFVGVVWLLCYANIPDVYKFKRTLCELGINKIHTSIANCVTTRGRDGDKSFAIGILTAVNTRLRGKSKVTIKEDYL